MSSVNPSPFRLRAKLLDQIYGKGVEIRRTGHTLYTGHPYHTIDRGKDGTGTEGYLDSTREQAEESAAILMEQSGQPIVGERGGKAYDPIRHGNWLSSNTDKHPDDLAEYHAGVRRYRDQGQGYMQADSNAYRDVAQRFDREKTKHEHDLRNSVGAPHDAHPGMVRDALIERGHNQEEVDRHFPLGEKSIVSKRGTLAREIMARAGQQNSNPIDRTGEKNVHITRTEEVPYYLTEERDKQGRPTDNYGMSNTLRGAEQQAQQLIQESGQQNTKPIYETGEKNITYENSYMVYENAKEAGTHKYGCLMAVVPDPLAAQVMKWCRDTIPDNLIAKGGRESEPHVTVLYGFTENTQETLRELQRIFSRVEPFKVKVVGLTKFDDGDDGAPLILKVKSDELRALNKLCKINFDHYDKYKTYKPHLTVAYVDPEHVDAFARLDPPFVGEEFEVHHVIYSSPSGVKTVIGLGQPIVGERGGKAYDKTGHDSFLAGTPNEHAVNRFNEHYDAVRRGGRSSHEAARSAHEMTRQQYESEKAKHDLRNSVGAPHDAHPGMVRDALIERGHNQEEVDRHFPLGEKAHWIAGHKPKFRVQAHPVDPRTPASARFVVQGRDAEGTPISPSSTATRHYLRENARHAAEMENEVAEDIEGHWAGGIPPQRKSLVRPSPFRGRKAMIRIQPSKTRTRKEEYEVHSISNPNSDIDNDSHEVYTHRNSRRGTAFENARVHASEIERRHNIFIKDPSIIYDHAKYREDVGLQPNTPSEFASDKLKEDGYYDEGDRVAHEKAVRIRRTEDGDGYYVTDEGKSGEGQPYRANPNVLIPVNYWSSNEETARRLASEVEREAGGGGVVDETTKALSAFDSNLGGALVPPPAFGIKPSPFRRKQKAYEYDKEGHDRYLDYDATIEDEDRHHERFLHHRRQGLNHQEADGAAAADIIRDYERQAREHSELRKREDAEYEANRNKPHQKAFNGDAPEIALVARAPVQRGGVWASESVGGQPEKLIPPQVPETPFTGLISAPLPPTKLQQRLMLLRGPVGVAGMKMAHANVVTRAADGRKLTRPDLTGTGPGNRDPENRWPAYHEVTIHDDERTSDPKRGTQPVQFADQIHGREDVRRLAADHLRANYPDEENTVSN